MELRNRAETDEVLEIANDVACEYSGGITLEFPRIRELLRSEKELSKANGILAAWEIFRQGISEQYPELLKWCPGYTNATPAPHEVGNYEPLDFLLPGNQPLEIMEGETMQEFEERMRSITIHDPELPGVVIIDSSEHISQVIDRVMPKIGLK